MAQLIEAETQGDANFCVEFPGRELIDDEIELGLAAQRTQNQLPGEARIARIQLLCVRDEQI